MGARANRPLISIFPIRKRITPFLLGRVKDLTEGTSLEANIQLVLNNADIGSQIAVNI
jgi:pseudouridine-5'-phosphate glycosidase